MSNDGLPTLEAGKRITISGRTGNGKSTLACWLLNRSKQHWIILNPKHTASFNHLPDSNVLRGFEEKKFLASVEKFKYTIINFSGEQATPDFMDSVVSYAHESFENVGLCVDELYTLHTTGGRAGAGLVGWLTRGRELKQTYLGLTQRPAWISRFCYSEADYIGGMDLTQIKDRKTLVENSGCDYFLGRLEPYQWLWYDVAKDRAVKYGKVPMIK
jgi:hypothetical protein